VLKPKDDDEQFQTETQSVKKCFVRMPKNEANTSKESCLVEDRNNHLGENGVSDSDGNKSKVKLDQSNNCNG